MTNREWLRTLKIDNLASLIAKKCPMCEHNNSSACRITRCESGINFWLNAEHEEEPHKCPICGGEMGINYGNREDFKGGVSYKMHCGNCYITQEAEYHTQEEAIEAWNNLFRKQEENENE